MYTWIKTVLGVTLASLLAAGVWGCLGVTRHLIVALDKWGDAAVQLGRAGDGASLIEQRIGAKHGTVAMLDEDIGAAKSLIVHGDMVARHEQQQLTTWDQRGAELYANINGGVSDLRDTIRTGKDAVSAVQGTANAGSDLLYEAAASFRQMNDPHTGIAATLGNVNGGIADARKLVPEVARGITAGANTAQHIDGISGDMQTALHPILNPDKCTTRACKFKRAISSAKSISGGAEGMYYVIEVAKALF